MKKRRNIIYRSLGLLLGLSISTCLLSGCSDTDPDKGTATVTVRITTEKKTESGTEQPTEQPTEGKPGGGTSGQSKLGTTEIILVSGYSNGAWTYQDHGTFVNGLGQVYTYNFDMPYWPGAEAMNSYERMELLSKSIMPAGEMDMDVLNEIYEYGMKIDPKSKMEVEQEMCDYGENSIVFHNPETDEWITCYEQGDNTGYRDDRYARKLADLWMDKEQTAVKITDTIPDRLLVPGDVPMGSIHSGQIELEDRQKKFYMTESMDALRKFAREKGFDVEKFLSGLKDSEKENVVIFLQINNVVNTGVDFNTDGILFGNGSLRFLEASTNVYEEDGQVDPDRLDGYVYIAVIPNEVFDREGPYGLNALNGETWIEIK